MFELINEYEKEILMSAMLEDCLVVLAHGLGYERIMYRFLQMYNVPDTLILVINTSKTLSNIYSNIKTNELQGITTFKYVTGEQNSHVRNKLYQEGGVICVSTRVLLADMITNIVPLELVTGIVISDFHEINPHSHDVFVCEIFRQKNSNGFIKAFTDQPHKLMAGFELESLLRTIQISSIMLWPRFHETFQKHFDHLNLDVNEIYVKISQFELVLQNLTIKIIQTILENFKKSSVSNDTEFVSLLNLKSFLDGNFLRLFRSFHGKYYNSLPKKYKDIYLDLKLLKTILYNIYNTDCISFHKYLVEIVNSISMESISEWLLSEDFDALITLSKRRFDFLIKNVNNYPLFLETLSTKWLKLLETIEMIYSASIKDISSQKTVVLLYNESQYANIYDLVFNVSDLIYRLLNDISTVIGSLNAESILSLIKITNGFSNLKDKIFLIDCKNCKIINYDQHAPLKHYDEHLTLLMLLNLIQPHNVVIYDIKLSFIRTLEIFKYMNSNVEMTIYFLIQKDSIEETQYINFLNKEKEIFINLIQTKVSFVPSLIQQPSEIDTLCNIEKSSSIIIVDSRELKSILPCYLHEQFKIELATLTIGDYILTPDIAVERKSPSDLCSSFQNGRLYNQSTILSDAYKNSIILIEFDSNKMASFNSYSFINVPHNQISRQTITMVETEPNKKIINRVNSIHEQIVLLILNIPKITLCWSPSPQSTVLFFKQIKKNKAQPNKKEAINLGIRDDQLKMNNSELLNPISSPFLFNNSINILKRIPFIYDIDSANIQKTFKNIRQLMNADTKLYQQVFDEKTSLNLWNLFNTNF